MHTARLVVSEESFSVLCFRGDGRSIKMSITWHVGSHVAQLLAAASQSFG